MISLPVSLLTLYVNPLVTTLGVPVVAPQRVCLVAGGRGGGRGGGGGGRCEYIILFSFHPVGM